MSNRRSFISRLGLLSAGAIAPGFFEKARAAPLHRALQDTAAVSAKELASDEDFWKYVRQSYTIPPDLINLNNGAVSPAPKPVADAMKRNYDFSNLAPSYYMLRIQDKGKESIRENLARLAGCNPEELALVRNTTEALETVVMGLDLKAGDEVVLAKQDYSSMTIAWKQRERRDGIKLVWVDLDLPNESDAYFVNQFSAAFTAKTKLVQVTHMINWSGQILPVRKIADAAKQHNIDVMVDGAHSFAHFDFMIPDLNCDYFGTSLHKWLGAPVGTGMLYVRKEKIEAVWPMFGATENQEGNIRKFEHAGTKPVYIEEAIKEAISFHELIGIRRKEERLLYLKNYWMSKVKDLPKVKLLTSLKKEYGCAIGMISVQGHTPVELDVFLMNNYRIHTVPITWSNIVGLRVTPNVYTSLKDLDKLVEGIGKFVQ